LRLRNFLLGGGVLGGQALKRFLFALGNRQRHALFFDLVLDFDPGSVRPALRQGLQLRLGLRDSGLGRSDAGAGVPRVQLGQQRAAGHLLASLHRHTLDNPRLLGAYRHPVGRLHFPVRRQRADERFLLDHGESDRRRTCTPHSQPDHQGGNHHN
jgi:hypothetical protein